MSKRTIYILSGIILFLLTVGLYAYFSEKDSYSWYKSLRHEQKDPYDLLLFEKLCNRVDKNESIEEVKLPFSIFQKNILKSSSKTNNLFLHVGNFRSFDYENADSLISFLRMGNSAMVFEESSNFATIINQLNGIQKTSYQTYNGIEDSEDIAVPPTVDTASVVIDSDTLQTVTDSTETIVDEESNNEATVSDSAYQATDSAMASVEEVAGDTVAPDPSEDEYSTYDEDSHNYGEDTSYYLYTASYTHAKVASCITADFTKLDLKPKGTIEHCYYNDFKKDSTEYFFFDDSLLKINHKGKKFQKMEYLGFWEGKPILIKYQVGKGSLYLCSQPLLLSNYFLKEKEGHLFFNALFKDFQKPNIFYNKYTHYSRNDKHNKNFTPLKYVLSQPPLKWGFYILLSLLVFFFIFFSKRRQKIIPVLPLKENSTIEYVETISRLYQSKKAHRDVLDIISKNFLKFIYHKYGIRFKHFDEDFAMKLSKISGVGQEQIKSIFEDIDKYVHRRTAVNAQKLNEFYNKIKNFYNNCK